MSLRSLLYYPAKIRDISSSENQKKKVLIISRLKTCPKGDVWDFEMIFGVAQKSDQAVKIAQKCSRHTVRWKW